MNAVQLQAARTIFPAPEEVARADLYALLASLLYAAPGRDLLDTVARTPLLSDEPEGELRTAWLALQAACAAADPEALRQQFDDLFVGVGHPLLRPYASYYLAGALNEAPLVELRDELARLGFGTLHEDVVICHNDRVQS